MYTKVCEKQNIRKVSKLLLTFVAAPDVVEKYAKIIQSNSFDNCVYRYNIDILNLFDPKLQLIITKPMFKNKLEQLLSELKKLQVPTILEYKK